MSSFSLFVNCLVASPLQVPFCARYVCVGPNDLGLDNIQKVYAIFRDEAEPITMEIDASNSSNLMGSIVLDSTVTLEYMITGNVIETTSN